MAAADTDAVDEELLGKATVVDPRLLSLVGEWSTDDDIGCRGSDGSRTVLKSHNTTVSFMYLNAFSLNRPFGMALDRLCLALLWISVVPSITCSFHLALARSSW